MIKEAWWSGWVWVGECSFWYRPTRVVPDQRPLNGRCCCCCYSGLKSLDLIYKLTHTLLTILFSGLPGSSCTRKVKPIWILLKERDHVCTSLQTDNHGSTPPLSFLQVRCPSCHPTKSVKALKAPNLQVVDYIIWLRCLPLAVVLNLSETTAYKWKINNFKSSVYFWHLKYMH